MTASMFYLATDGLQGVGSDDVLVVGGDEGRHGVAVKRLRVGEAVLIGDGQGTVVDAKVGGLNGKESFQARVERVQWIQPPQPHITVVQALIKGDRMDRALETITEAGADELCVWPATNSIARLGPDQLAKSQSRFERKVFETSKQARRAWRPKVRLTISQDQILQTVADADVAVLLEESAQADLVGVVPAQASVFRNEQPQPGEAAEQALVPKSIAIIVGPEGGFGHEEREQLLAAGAVSARMGPDVLRASTAATVALGWVMGASRRWAVTD